MRIVTANGTEKDLAAHPEIGPRGDELGDHVQLPCERGRRENRLQGRETRESGGQKVVRGDSAGDSIRIGLLKQIIMRQGQEISEGLQTDVGIGAAVESGEANTSVGGNAVGKDQVADLERICPGNRDRKRYLRIAIERVKHIRHSPTPTGATWLIGDGGLPLDRLVGMRKELRRNSRPAREILGTSDRRDEGAHVRDDAEVALIEKALQFRQTGMETKVTAVTILQSKWKKGRLGDCENASRRGLRGIAVRVVRDDDIVRVISAVKKQANERPVVIPIGNSGRAQPAEI